MISISNRTKARLPRLAFSVMEKMRAATLGTKYDLSLAIVPPAEIRKLNRMYRGMDKPTDILSFPLSKKEGEMFICIPETKKEAKRFGRTYENFLLFLFIHGCVHLKGFDHGSTMERIEARFRKKFNV